MLLEALGRAHAGGGSKPHGPTTGRCHQPGGRCSRVDEMYRAKHNGRGRRAPAHGWPERKRAREARQADAERGGMIRYLFDVAVSRCERQRVYNERQKIILRGSISGEMVKLQVGT